MSMKWHHWVGAVVVLVIGYFIGVNYPSIGQSAKAKVGL